MRSEDFIESLHNISEVADTDVKEKVQKWLEYSESDKMKGITLCTEEFAELIVALSKYVRYGDAILKSGNLYEELADVSLFIDYV